jgi:hypothetical protein
MKPTTAALRGFAFQSQIGVLFSRQNFVGLCSQGERMRERILGQGTSPARSNEQTHFVVPVTTNNIK